MHDLKHPISYQIFEEYMRSVQIYALEDGTDHKQPLTAMKNISG